MTLLGLYTRAMKRLAVDSPSPSLKHLPMLLAFIAALIVTLSFREMLVTNLLSLGLAGIVMLAATVLAAFFSRPGRESTWSLLVPSASLLAVALLRYATGGPPSLFSSLIILPVVWIASQAGRRWILVAILGASAALMLPYVIELRWPANPSEWLRGMIAPISFGLAAVVINELSRQARRQVNAVERLAREGEDLLMESL
jgi:sigma-B regulation protein RsbU (phosphoserine phosphatase)